MGCGEAGNVQSAEETASWMLKSMWGLLSIKFPKIDVVVCFAFFAFKAVLFHSYSSSV